MIEPVYIAEHLLYSEVACPCCGTVVFTPALGRAWDQIRNVLDQPIQVTLGYRCPRHNKAVGGSKNSQHLAGNALDIACRHIDLESVLIFRLLLDAGFRGIGHGRGIFHIDVRPDPYFWRYVSGGEARDEPLFDLYQSIMKEKH